jgi:UDP-N-acetylmuramoyl-L-alanyl-D-glutamate--2,6-diaminopimelate ligase
MRLSALVRDCGDLRRLGDGDPEVTALTADSRAVVPGALFAALAGTVADGSRYAGEAVSRGASVVLAGRDLGLADVVQLVHPAPRRALAELAARFHGHPARALALVGITGTNGKTTVAYLLRHLLRALGRAPGMLGTVEYDLGGAALPAPLTTPGAVDFASHLAAMRDRGCTHAVVEVSSHALSQERVHGHPFACGVFTNLTRDHMDYHGSLAAYRDAKRRLFDDLDPGAWAVVNRDDPAAAEMVRGTAARIWTYALQPGADLVAEAPDYRIDGTTFRVRTVGEALEVRSPLVGRHNVQNLLAALSAACCLGLPLSAAAAAAAASPGVPGRLERIAGAPEGGPAVFVDYAHTDDALRAVLAVLRPLVTGRLVCVFGCGGDRDRGKRPLMGRVAEAGADRVFLTNDNPRTEDPAAILDDIRAGLLRPEDARLVPDRRAAVTAAVREAGPGDAVLVAGKGHETTQVIGRERIPMDDRVLAREALGAAAAAAGRS